jgi:hypothetical protein
MAKTVLIVDDASPRQRLVHGLGRADFDAGDVIARAVMSAISPPGNGNRAIDLIIDDVRMSDRRGHASVTAISIPRQ